MFIPGFKQIIIFNFRVSLAHGMRMQANQQNLLIKL